MRPIPDRCPCDAGRSYDQCCGPFHRGEREAPDAPSLMRSRYSAFARGDEDYVLRTLHPDHADLEEGVEAMRASLRDTFRRNRYEGLRVLDQRPAGSDGLAEVLFQARVREGGVDRSFVERSYFAHEGVGWRYLAGDLLPAAALKGRIEGLTLDAFSRALESAR
ncbi:MAG: YchJ family metal-binding protein [Deltaproteobacteria bacterium]|nr:YchJ family metal-binding protein [Deltaproteobacteria bacterium]